jgi:hypothetical protein
MRGKLAGHDHTYCHHSMSEAAQELGAFIVEHGIPTEAVAELAFGMIADAAFAWREDRETPHPVEEALKALEETYAPFLHALRLIEEKRELPTTKEGWAEYLRKHGEEQAEKLKSWSPTAFKRRKKGNEPYE